MEPDVRVYPPSLCASIPFCNRLWTIISCFQHFRHISTIHQNFSTIHQIVSTNHFYFQHCGKIVQQLIKLFNTWITILENKAKLFNGSLCFQQLWPFYQQYDITVQQSAKLLNFDTLFLEADLMFGTSFNLSLNNFDIHLLSIAFYQFTTFFQQYPIHFTNR